MRFGSEAATSPGASAPADDAAEVARVLCAAAPLLAAGETGLAGVVNINTATAEELQLLPGIGEAVILIVGARIAIAGRHRDALARLVVARRLPCTDQWVFKCLTSTLWHSPAGRNSALRAVAE